MFRPLWPDATCCGTCWRYISGINSGNGASHTHTLFIQHHLFVLHHTGIDVPIRRFYLLDSVSDPDLFWIQYSMAFYCRSVFWIRIRDYALDKSPKSSADFNKLQFSGIFLTIFAISPMLNTFLNFASIRGADSLNRYRYVFISDVFDNITELDPDIF